MKPDYRYTKADRDLCVLLVVVTAGIVMCLAMIVGRAIGWI